MKNYYSKIEMDITPQIQPITIPQIVQTPTLINPQPENQIEGDKISKILHFNLIERHRRSKHEQEGRTFQCEHCSKSYLSKPALNNHMNTKHADILQQMNITKRKRGRPRKYLIDQPENNFEKTKYENFFNDNRRKKEITTEGTSKEISYKNVVQSVFDSTYIAYKGKFWKDLTSYEEEPILNYLMNKRELNLSECNDIMCSYLDYVAPLTNEKYFTILVKFIILFKECVNTDQKKQSPLMYTEKEYTKLHNAEIIPEECNEFFCIFLETNNFFGFSEDDKNELIEIIQHFCYWLFVNNHTKSKLSLAG